MPKPPKKFNTAASKDEDINVHEIDPVTKRTVLHRAVIKGNLDEVKKLLDLGANPNKLDVSRTAVHLAADKPEIFETLLKYGGDPKRFSTDGLTAFHMAANAGNIKTMTMCLKKGMSPNDFSKKDKISVLHEAAAGDDLYAFQFLIENGGRLDLEDNAGWNIFHHAAKGNAPNIIEFLVEQDMVTLINKNAKDPDGRTPLHVALAFHNIESARSLLEAGASPNIKDSDGWMPIHCVINRDNLPALELLMEYGSDLNKALTNSNQTPLFRSVREQNYKIMVYLLENGANPNIPSVTGETPLHLIGKTFNTDIAEKLIENGAEINAQRDNGQTPLHYAASHNRRDLVQLFLEKGADPTIKDNKGRYAHQIAQAPYQQFIFRILTDAVEKAEKEKKQDENKKPWHGRQGPPPWKKK